MNVVWWDNAHTLNRIESVCHFASIFLSVCQSGIRHRAISRQTIRLSRESATHPPMTSIVFLYTVFLAYPFCQRVRKYNASDRINRSLPCRVHCYQNGETDFLAIFVDCTKSAKLQKNHRKLRIYCKSLLISSWNSLSFCNHYRILLHFFIILCITS